jgi:hypothetical protein
MNILIYLLSNIKRENPSFLKTIIAFKLNKTTYL